MKKVSIIFVASLVFITIISCKTKEKGVQVSYKGPPTIIYKTKADYSKNVPVTLSDDKSKIVSYPAPTDVFYNGKLAYPVELADGFLLDNRGITKNTAFLKMTYEEYSRLKEVPKLDDMYSQIIDKDPITHIYNLGNRSRFKEPVPEINALIEHHKLKEFKKLK